MMVIVGCGDWTPIENYKSASTTYTVTYLILMPTRLSAHAEDTGFQGEIYANPDRKLYDNLGMIANLQSTTKGEEKRSYLKRGFLYNTLWSIWVRRLPISCVSTSECFPLP